MRATRSSDAPRRSRRGLWAGLIVFGLFAIAAAWLITTPRPAFSNADANELERPGDVEAGRLVFAAAQCASCHASPGQTDRLRLGGGLALPSPFGTFRVPNISPDPIDGIGRWRTIDLANALVAGVAPDGAHYYPALPYPNYARMRRTDIRDLMAYLRTLEPAKGRPPPHELRFPFTVRRGVGFWKLLFFDRAPFAPDPEQGEAWHRGRYLTETLAHCADCHSSRNIFGAVREDTRFAGGREPEGAGFVPNITPARIGAWTQAEIAELLTSGRTPDRRRVGSSMADVVTNTAMLPESDRLAIAAYVKSLPPRPTPAP